MIEIPPPEVPPVEGKPDEEPAELEINANDFMMQDVADPAAAAAGMQQQSMDMHQMAAAPGQQHGMVV